MSRRSGTALLLLLASFCCLLALSAWADSQARIVRLSDVEGNVQIDRATGEGYEKAFLNMPITQGVRLRTQADARAEVEFEDGSTIHLPPESMLEFTELSLRDSGAKVSALNLQQGEAYFNLTGKHDHQFYVTFNHERVAVAQATHFRVKLDDQRAELAVFKGAVKVDGPAGQFELSSKHTASFDLGSDHYEIAKKVGEEAFDTWDRQLEGYHRRNASNAYNAPYTYGVSDLNYYGNYYNVPGYGMCWQPFFTSYGWNPFTDGAWMWYPGFGYSWVSAYPWGWMPYHYGNWLFVPGHGWLWQPGGSWVGWNRLPPVVNPPRQFLPPHPPVIGGRSLVAVGRGPTASPVAATAGSRVVLGGNNAGLNIPRSFSSLRRLNNELNQHGSATLTAPVGSRGSSLAGGHSPGNPGPTSAPHLGRSVGTSRASPPASHSSGSRHR